MIPYIREKFAEKRAKWLAARNKRSNATVDKEETQNSTTSTDIEAAANVATTETKPIATTSLRTGSNGSNRSSTSRRLEPTNPPQRGRTSNRSPRRSNMHSTAAATVATQAIEPRQRLFPSGPANSHITPTTTTPILKNLKLNKTRRCSTSSSSQQNSAIASASNSKDLIEPSRQSKERIKVRIICPSARVLAFQTDNSKRLSELKNEIILELSDDPASLPLFATDIRQLSPRYRLLRAEYQGHELNEGLTLQELQINDSDTLVLVARRNYILQIVTQTRENQAPRTMDIDNATRTLPVRTVNMPMVDINEIFQQSNLQFDVRKVLISLAQASAIVLGAGPYANRLIAMLKQKLINKRNYQNDTLQCLVDMGFKKEKAEYALKIHQGVYSSALEFLIQHQSDEMPMEEAAMSMAKSQSVVSPSSIFTDQSILENTEALLEIVRIYSHRDIPPTPETVSALLEMGFQEPEILIALKKTCNNKAAACEWLCGNRSGSLVELRDGLAQDSPILRAILELPQVQLNLSNPKILLAFLSILENENSIRVWGGDNDTTSVITHILQKYHEEKHVMGINQFYSNR